jgi:hypothetical protein
VVESSERRVDLTRGRGHESASAVLSVLGLGDLELALSLE